MATHEATSMHGQSPRPSSPARTLTVVAALSVLPLSVDSITANYLFAAIPLTALLLGRPMAIAPTPFIPLAACGFLGLLVIGLLDNDTEFAARAIGAFAVFLLPFLCVIVRPLPATCLALRRGVVAGATAMSASALLGFVMAGGNDLGFSAKDLIGSQRAGFVYVAALCLCTVDARGRLARASPWAILSAVTLVAGTLLTFSRAAIVTLVVAVILIGVCNLKSIPEDRGALRPRNSGHRPGKWLLALLVPLSASVAFAPATWNFYSERIVDRWFLAEDNDSSALAEGTSEALRLEFASTILGHVNAHPVAGSGFVGVHSLGDPEFGSAHSQFGDVLFRCGWVGLLLYLVVLAKLLAGLRKHDLGMAIALFTVAFYGLFHESFRESQGACLLGFSVILSRIGTTHQ